MSQALVPMNHTTALAVDPYAPVDFEGAITLAAIIAKSRLFPSIQTPEQALVVISMGHDLGLSPMQACRGIQIIEGRPSPSADTFAAVVIASGKAEYFRERETTETASTWETKRVGDSKIRTSTFTLADAQQAGLVKPKSNWEKYPRRMLSARAKAFLARDVYPDLMLGLYLPDEISAGASVETPRQVNVQVVAQPDLTAPTLADRIALADTLETLQRLAVEIRDTVPPGALRDALRAAYAERKAALTPAPAPTPAPVPAPASVEREPGDES